MPWQEVTRMGLRSEFVQLAQVEGVNFSELCRRFGISRKTGYKWLQRYRQEGAEGLVDRSRRPHHSPKRSPAEIEQRVLKVRQEHPAWGGRKIKAYLEQAEGVQAPSASTITAILHRQEQIDAEESLKHRAFQRFEMAHPNELWQMDFKGYFRLEAGGKCHPLTVLDDYSRFLIGLRACSDQSHLTVKTQLSQMFRQYGLPERMLMDNGSPWGDDAETRHTILTVWLMRLGIQVCHSRPYHPQTLGKDERLHRTLQAELLRHLKPDNLSECQAQFDRWREVYNAQRPHEALDLQPPASRYQPSLRPFPEVLPPIEYEPHDLLRSVDGNGRFRFRNRVFRVGKAFRGQIVALRPQEIDGMFAVYFCQSKIAEINLRDVKP